MPGRAPLTRKRVRDLPHGARPVGRYSAAAMPSEATELLLIRHGETDHNRQGRFQGQVDVPLNATGQQQAQRLAQRLRDEPLDMLVSSDLARARGTAEPLRMLRSGLALATDTAWREQAFGVLEGLVVAEARMSQPEAFAAWWAHTPDGAPPGGRRSG